MLDLELIEYAEKRIHSKEVISKEQIVQLLSIEPGSRAWEALGLAGRRAAKELTGERAYLWGAIGVDFVPCSMNCDFCSLGEKWGIVGERREYNAEETVRQVREYAENGVRWIVLRTTEFYSQAQLGEMIRYIREQVPGAYEIGLNIGEFGVETAYWLAECGVDFIYHSLRLGEGRDTRFEPQTRIDTLRAVQASPLKLVFLVEPIGVEHTNEEIADLCLLAADCGAIVSGAMARIPVQGTPLGVHLQVSDERMAQIIAVTRLACGACVPDICIHPGTQLAMEFGANVTVVETGAIPRDTCCCSGGKWNQFDTVRARELFEAAGYTVHQTA